MNFVQIGARRPRCAGSNFVLIPPEVFKSASPNGGGGGIRTHGSLRISGFQDRCNKPLYHPSFVLTSDKIRTIKTAAQACRRENAAYLRVCRGLLCFVDLPCRTRYERARFRIPKLTDWIERSKSVCNSWPLKTELKCITCAAPDWVFASRLRLQCWCCLGVSRWNSRVVAPARCIRRARD